MALGMQHSLLYSVCPRRRGQLWGFGRAGPVPPDLDYHELCLGLLGGDGRARASPPRHVTLSASKIGDVSILWHKWLGAPPPQRLLGAVSHRHNVSTRRTNPNPENSSKRKEGKGKKKKT